MNIPINERWKIVLDYINRGQLSPAASRDPVTLVAVSKAQPADAIEPLLEAGHRDFGENKVQEAVQKWPIFMRRYSDIKLHLVGSLQTNKVKEAIAIFSFIHTVDRQALADTLMNEIAKNADHRFEEAFIQVNTGEEPQKGGVLPANLATLVEYCRTLGLPITGLMCLPPVNEPPAPHFAFLNMLARGLSLKHLSIGMSGDYETAVRLGATHVRVGTALFGERA